MSSGLFKKLPTDYSFIYIYIYIYRQDLALNYLQRYICHKIQPTYRASKQLFLSNTNNFHTDVWFKGFLHNINNLYTIIWFKEMISLS